MAQAMLSNCPDALPTLALSAKHDPRLLSLQTFFLHVQRSNSRSFNNGDLEQAEGSIVGPSSCLGGLAANGAEQPSP